MAIVLGGNYPGGNYPGGNCPGGNSPGGNHPGGNCPGGNCPVTINYIIFTLHQITFECIIFFTT